MEPLREELHQGKCERASTTKASTRVKVRVSTRAPTRARARVSTRVKARAPGGTRATGTKERAITAARCKSVPRAGSIGRTIRTRFAPWTSSRRRPLPNRWSVRRAGWWARWTRLYPLQGLRGPDRGRWQVAPILARLLKYGPPGLGLRSAHGCGCKDVCHNPFKVLDQEEDFDIDEV